MFGMGLKQSSLRGWSQHLGGDVVTKLGEEAEPVMTSLRADSRTVCFSLRFLKSGARKEVEGGPFLFLGRSLTVH